MQTYLTTIHGNSWDCPILSSLSQLLPDTLSDLISDTRSALLRDSLWWEADKEEGCNSDQAEHRSFDICCFVPPQSATRILSSYCNQSSWLTVRATAGIFIPALIYATTWSWDLSEIWLVEVTHTRLSLGNLCKFIIAIVTLGLKITTLTWLICADMIR